ncbi:hypothetical protein [Rhabdothermincola salaria]|uniref:hypothetical protein n=1 Tax=Rhabdothermincola salaria TaxID=2903142 RepID=UPI001E2E789C|nr:hypothetical protein [Rhabdothermincola salaria]MCD9625304.1 hypothetical protein [Rhabdothermincola salaria]
MDAATSWFTARSTRIVIDVLFLVLTLSYVIADIDHQHTLGAVLWGVVAVFWLAMIPFDWRRSTH